MFHGITINHQQQVLVVGVGTGADLELLDLDGMEITAIDYSEDMLNQARKKFKDSSIQFIEMDAQQMTFADNQFDVVIGSLILSVVPHAEDCFKEMERVLKPGGEILLFDKFLPREKSSHFLKMIRPAIKLLGTDIGLDFDRLVENNNGTLLVKEDVPVLFNGMYRKIVLSKQRI
nr:class I SAM-dependent methyltransferase [Planococcus glaciei]